MVNLIMYSKFGHGHRCLHCITEYQKTEDSGRYDVYPLSRIHQKPIKRGRISRIFSILSIIVILVSSYNAVAEKELLDISFIPDPFSAEGDIQNIINVNNMTDANTSYAEWERDLGTRMPNGTYYGTLFPPSLFEFNFEATWEQNNTYSNTDGRFTYAMVSGHFNLTSQKIMSGTSEWWLRAPISPDSVEAYFGLILCIFKGVDNSSDVQIYGNYTADVSTVGQKPRATHNGYAPDVVIHYDSTAGILSNGEKFSDHNPPGDMIISNGRMYLKVNAVLEPSVDYVLSLLFRLPKDGTLRTFWTQCEMPAGGWTSIEVAEMFIHDAIGQTVYIDLMDHKKEDFSLDLDWSFIFVQGVGRGGLFGKKMTIPENHTLVLYPFFNTSRSGNQYMSFMLPFISNQTVNVTPKVFVAHGDSWNFSNGDYFFDPWIPYSVGLTESALEGNQTIEVDDTEHLYIGKHIYLKDSDSGPETNFIKSMSGNFLTLYYKLQDDYTKGNGAHLELEIPMGWNYTDFILFSTNDTLNWTTFEMDEQWNVELELLFNDDITLTLLCYYEKERPSYLWSEIPLNNTSKNPYFHPHTFNRAGDGEYDLTYRLHYNVWISARGTDGQWAIRNGTASGGWTYTHYFPKRVFLSSAEWEMISTPDGELVKILLDFAKHFSHLSHSLITKNYVDAVKWSFKSSALIFRTAGLIIGGIIRDRLSSDSSLWQQFKKFGAWIASTVMEFAGKIWNFINNAIDTIVGFWESFKYTIAPMLMMAIVAMGGRAVSKLLEGRGS
jgi:hypothetical protein